MRRRGRPILGAFAGFFSGLFLATTLLLFGAVALDSPVLIALPVAGLVVVTILAWWCPWGGRTGLRGTSAADSVAVTVVVEGADAGSPVAEPAAGPAEDPGAGTDGPTEAST